MFIQKQLSEGFFKKGVLRNICDGISFLFFFCEFCEFVRTYVLQSNAGRLFLIIEASRVVSIVSVVTKGVLANETVNYGTKTQTYVLIWAISVSYWKWQPRWKNKFQKQSFADFKLGVDKSFVNSTGKHLCWSLFLIKLQA